MMDERERKQMAFLAGMLLRLAHDEWLNDNELQQLDNIASDLGFNDLDEKEFRY